MDRVGPDPTTVKCIALAGLAVLFSALAVSDASATEPSIGERRSYSLFSAGGSLIDYEESSTFTINGNTVDVETDSGLIVTQFSGTFVTVDDRWGVHLQTRATLGLTRSDESWEIDGAVVRTNQVSYDRQSLAILGSRALPRQGYLLVGGQYSRTEFERFGARLAPSAASFGIEPDTVETGAVSETVWDVSLMVGYERSTLFNNTGAGWRIQWQAMLGLPVITTISNTDIALGASFDETFDGLQVQLNGTVGYQFSDRFLVGVDVALHRVARSAIEGSSLESAGIASFPSNDSVFVYTGLGVYWSF